MYYAGVQRSLRNQARLPSDCEMVSGTRYGGALDAFNRHTHVSSKAPTRIHETFRTPNQEYAKFATVGKGAAYDSLEDDTCSLGLEHIHHYHRLIESLLDFAYKGEIDVEYAALAPFAVLARRVGFTELIRSSKASG